MKNLILVAALAAAAGCASACSPFAGGPVGASANTSQVLGSLADTAKAINSACTGTFAANITFAPPLPPVGNLNVNQTCGVKDSAAAAAKSQ